MSISSTIHSSQEAEAIQMSTKGGMDKQDVVYIINTMEYYSSIREEILVHAIPQMKNLEDIIISQINQSQKVQYGMIL